MFASSDLNACAALVERGDPTRFLAVMAAPVQARQVLFALFAFNLEVVRAPWVTQQQMLAEMRLQWWCDALDEIAAQKPVRRHEVVTPLAALIDSQSAVLLRDLVTARRWDIYDEPFKNDAEFAHYIDCTSGHLLVVATGILGRSDPQVVRDFAFSMGLSNWFRAVPQLLAQKRHPLLELTSGSVRDLAEQGLKRLAMARSNQGEGEEQRGAHLTCDVVGHEVEGACRAQGDDGDARRVQRPVAVRGDTLSGSVLVEQHVVGRRVGREHARAHEGRAQRADPAGERLRREALGRRPRLAAEILQPAAAQLRPPLRWAQVGAPQEFRLLAGAEPLGHVPDGGRRGVHPVSSGQLCARGGRRQPVLQRGALGDRSCGGRAARWGGAARFHHRFGARLGALRLEQRVKVEGH